jgi:bifunctional non-homologous end joining protein LigD
VDVRVTLPPLSPGPMLATAGQPPAGPEWIAEAKWDGARSISRVHATGVDMLSRPGNNMVARFPDLVAALSTALRGHTAILDGEIVAFGKDGRPDFGRLQRRLRVTRPTAGLRTAVPASLYLFDILHLDGCDLTRRPYVERRAVLEDLGLGRDGAVVVPPCWHDLDGQVLLEVTRDLGLEGVVCKRTESTYQAGRRSRAWVKTPIRRKAAVVVIGWVGGRADAVGALLLAAHDHSGRLVYCGAVTSGLSRIAKRSLYEQLRALELPTSPFAGERHAPMIDNVHWARPQLVGAVEYREFTGRLRHPAWKGVIAADPSHVVLPDLK